MKLRRFFLETVNSVSGCAQELPQGCSLCRYGQDPAPAVPDQRLHSLLVFCFADDIDDGLILCRAGECLKHVLLELAVRGGKLLVREHENPGEEISPGEIQIYQSDVGLSSQRAEIPGQIFQRPNIMVEFGNPLMPVAELGT